MRIILFSSTCKIYQQSPFRFDSGVHSAHNLKEILMKTLLLGSFLLLSNVALANETYVLKGKGVDGKACSVRIVSDKHEIKSIDLNGATEQYEILAETESGYKPKRSISERGGSEIISFLQKNPSLYKELQTSSGVFTDSMSYKLDTSDLPRTSEDLGGIKAKVLIKLNFQNKKLSKVHVNFKGKALFITLASSTFECQ